MFAKPERRREGEPKIIFKCVSRVLVKQLVKPKSSRESWQLLGGAGRSPSLRWRGHQRCGTNTALPTPPGRQWEDEKGGLFWLVGLFFGFSFVFSKKNNSACHIILGKGRR